MGKGDSNGRSISRVEYPGEFVLQPLGQMQFLSKLIAEQPELLEEVHGNLIEREVTMETRIVEKDSFKVIGMTLETVEGRAGAEEYSQVV